MMARRVFIGGVVVVTILIITSRHYHQHKPDKVQWISSTDLTKLFLPQRQEVSRPPSVKNVVPEVNMAEVLYKKVRILCWIMTSPKTLHPKAKAVYETWATRCNIFLFMSSAANETIPNVVALNVSEGRDHLTAKTMKGFQYVWDHYRNEADWFMKADDDTYVIVENLRYLLAHHDPESPIYFGHHFQIFLKQGYMSGGAGYVLSKEALRRVTMDGVPNNKCQTDHGSEDYIMGVCLEKLGVAPERSIDTFKRESFHPFSPKIHYNGEYPKWYHQFTKYGLGKGKECCSDYSITFHYVAPDVMYLLDFLIYRLKPFGVSEKFNASLVNSLFQHKKPYMQTIAVLPTAKPEGTKTAVVPDKVRVEKIKKYLSANKIKVVQKVKKKEAKADNKIKVTQKVEKEKTRRPSPAPTKKARR